MFIRTKRQKVKGKVYTYQVREKRIWVNGRVKSIHLGRVDDEYDRIMERVLRAAERQAREIEEYQRKHFGETAAERSAREAKEREWTQQKFLEQTKGPTKDAEPRGPTPSSDEAGPHSN